MYVTFEDKLPGNTDFHPVRSPDYPDEYEQFALAWLEGYLGTSTWGGGVITIRNFKIIREG